LQTADKMQLYCETCATKEGDKSLSVNFKLLFQSPEKYLADIAEKAKKVTKGMSMCIYILIISIQLKLLNPTKLLSKAR